MKNQNLSLNNKIKLLELEVKNKDDYEEKIELGKKNLQIFNIQLGFFF